MIEKGVDEFHFLKEALAGLELVDGELVVTYGLNKAFPLIRYRTGDFFEIAREGCDCGLIGQTLRWSGRADVDKLRVHGFEIKAEEVDDVFNAVSPLVDGYQVHFYKEPSNHEKTRIVVEIMKKEGQLLQDESIFGMIQRELLNNWHIAPRVPLSEAIRRGTFSALDIKFVKEFTTQSQKNRRLVSHIN